MDENKKITEDFDREESPNTYRTGSIQLPKGNGGVVAFLLGLVIFLCGISTALGLMNIKLRFQLNVQELPTTCPVAFARATESAGEIIHGENHFRLGFTGEAVSDFWNLYEDLPQGIYATHVCDPASAMEPGDILLSVDGVRITDAASLTALLQKYAPGDTLEVLLYRDGQQLTAQLNVG